MSMMRLPLTVWSYFIASILGLLAFPPLTAAAVMLLFDRHLGTSFFLPSGLVVANKLLTNTGGIAAAVAAPVLVPRPPRGVRPAFCRRSASRATSCRRSRASRCSATALSVYCLMAVGVLSMIVWGHHMFVSGMSPFTGEYFSLVTLTITVPMTIFGVNMLGEPVGREARARVADAVRAAA